MESLVFSQVLHQIDNDAAYSSGTFRHVMARAIERSQATVSRVFSEETTLDQDQTARLSRAICRELEDPRLARCFVDGPFIVMRVPEVFINGSHADELEDLAEQVGAYVTAMKDRRGEDALHAAEQIVAIGQRMLAEAKHR